MVFPMIVGIGIDLTDIERVAAVYSRYRDHFLTRFFSKDEINLIKKRQGDLEIRLAGRFAAKEALIKALGNITDQIIHLSDIEILSKVNGCPYAALNHRLDEITRGYRIDISISHEKKLAMAMAIVSKED